ncbi:MAG: hypothetical protein PHT12_02075 [Patescibacteria group bacterium]|nr:hypothetical protein [Patescibacteria group bacterium]
MFNIWKKLGLVDKVCALIAALVVLVIVGVSVYESWWHTRWEKRDVYSLADAAQALAKRAGWADPGVGIVFHVSGSPKQFGCREDDTATVGAGGYIDKTGHEDWEHVSDIVCCHMVGWPWQDRYADCAFARHP